VLAVVALLLGLLTGYASRVFFNADQFANHVSAAIEKPEVQDEVGRKITDQVVGQHPDLIGVRPVIDAAASGIVGSSQFRSLLRSSVADVHRTIFEQGTNTVTVTIADVTVLLRSAIEQFAPKVAKKLPSDEDAAIFDGRPPAWALDLARTADGFRSFTTTMLVFFLLLAVGGFLLAVDRRGYVSFLGMAVAVGAVIMLVAYHLIRSAVLGHVSDPDSEAAAAAIWDTFLSNLQITLLFAAGIGAILAAAARSLIKPVAVEARLYAAWRRAMTVPERPVARVGRALLLVLAGLWIVLNRDAAIDLVVLAVGIFVIYKGVEEILRMIARPEEAEATPTEPRVVRRRRLAIAGGGALVAVLAIGIVLAIGGASEPAAKIGKGCEGSENLCDRPLADVALPATHNAMSGADVPGYLFANQEHGVPQQLDDGVRALLIDAHYGIPANGGKVKTDLENPSSKERKEYEKELGPQAVDAALRIRDRLVTGPDAEHAIYFCHRFCELGAVPGDEMLSDIRDFVVQHPDQVLVVDVEDYVKPADFVAAVQKAGLDQYAYSGPITSSTPTLREMIDSGKPVIFMAENKAGVEPWYRNGYDDVIQETPYHFTDPAELTDAKQVPQSCKPNRGPADAPLFLMNHWIDTSPSPRPSNAEQVNAYRPLLRRARECERKRGQPVNLVAVDFYATGDLFKVVDKLNGVGR
jgi:hypothetical protein